MSAARARFLQMIDQLAIEQYGHTGPDAYFALARWYASNLGIPYSRESAVQILHDVYTDLYLRSNAVTSFERAQAEEEEEEGQREYQQQMAAQAQQQTPGRGVMPESHPVIRFGEPLPPPQEDNNGPPIDWYDQQRKIAGTNTQAIFDREGPDAIEDAYRSMGNPFGGG